MNSESEPRKTPYQGLIPYTEKDANFFFGRERETQLITANLFAYPLTILYGPSGVGKSSVLRAGLVYQLAQRSDLNIVYNSDWKDDPLATLRLAFNTLPGLYEIPNTNLPLDEFLAESFSRIRRRLMIVLDQFEEYFLYHPEEDEFTAQFSQAVMQTDAPISFLVSIREDALAKLDRFEGRLPMLFDNYLRLENLDDVAARSAIEKPIEKYNELYLSRKEPIRIEPELVDEVLRQLKSGQVSLIRTGLGVIGQELTSTIETPYLQLVMTRIWNQEVMTHSRTLRLATLKNLGGSARIVHTHLDSVMKQLTYSQRSIASKVFQYLVTPSGTKIALNARDLASFAKSPPRMVQSVLQRLTQPDVRLLRVVESVNNKEMNYEIFHDVLAASILDWRARYHRRSRRALWLLFFAIFFFSCLFPSALIAERGEKFWSSFSVNFLVGISIGGGVFLVFLSGYMVGATKIDLPP